MISNFDSARINDFKIAFQIGCLLDVRNNQPTKTIEILNRLIPSNQKIILDIIDWILTDPFIRSKFIDAILKPRKTGKPPPSPISIIAGIINAIIDLSAEHSIPPSKDAEAEFYEYLKLLGY